MVLDTVYLCMCQSGGDVPEGVQLQNLGVTNGSTTQNTEEEPMKWTNPKNINMIVHEQKPNEMIKAMEWISLFVRTFC